MSNKRQRVQPKRSDATPPGQPTAPSSADEKHPREPRELEWHLESVIQFATD